jgi:hypothetical protein
MGLEKVDVFVSLRPRLSIRALSAKARSNRVDSPLGNRAVVTNVQLRWVPLGSTLSESG